MSADQDIWQVWASSLQQWGITEWVASLLEAAGPLTILGAQIFYLGQPLFSRTLSETHLEAMARLLEDSTQTREFINFLREALAGEPI